MPEEMLLNRLLAPVDNACMALLGAVYLQNGLGPFVASTAVVVCLFIYLFIFVDFNIFIV